MTTLTGTASSRGGRHVARRSIRTLFSVRSMVTTTFALILAIGLAGVATGGTYALWNKSQATASNGAISAGSADLTVSTALAMPTTAMYPGAVLYGSAVLTNTGTIPLTLRTSGLAVPTSTPFTQALSFGFATASTAANCSAGTVTSAWVYSTFAAPSVATIGTALPVGQSSVLCVSVKFSGSPANSTQGQSALNFTATIDGIQN